MAIFQKRMQREHTVRGKGIGGQQRYPQHKVKVAIESGGGERGIHSQTCLLVYPAPLSIRLVTLVKLSHFSMCQFPQL